MKIRFLPLWIAALLLCVATSQARARRHPHNAQTRSSVPPIALDSSDDGPLSRDRGLSQGENAAVGTLLKEVAGAPAAAGSGAGPAPPARRLSPDYYRVYSQRIQSAVGARKTAVAAPVAKPQPAPVPANVVAKAPAAPPPNIVVKAPPAALPPPAAKATAAKPHTVFATQTVVAKPPIAGKPAVVATATGVKPHTVFAQPTVVRNPQAALPQTANGAPARVLFRD